jgi:hypothetical protein
VEKPDGKRPFGRPRCGKEDRIKIDLKKVEGGFGMVDLADDTDK